MTQLPARAFTHEDDGTGEAEWAAVLHRRHAPELSVRPRIVVVSAHPDDEALGCGGYLYAAVRAGCIVTIVLATWGEASHPHSPTLTPTEIAERRRAEMRHAITALETPGNPIALRALGLPDGRLVDHHHRTTAAIVEAIGDDGPHTLVLAPWRQDGHPDHAAAGHAAAAATARTDAFLAEYPIWFWHWGDPQALSCRDLLAHHLDDDAERAKSRAVAAHVSQVEPLSPAPQDAPVLPPQVLAHFTRNVEWFIEPVAPVDDLAFEQLHRTRPDPWLSDSPYERAKRAATVALSDRLDKVQSALEIGCSAGALTADLAARIAVVDAIEPAPTALSAAIAATAHLPNVRILAGAAPHGIPDRVYDLVVLSEVGYFLSPAALAATLDRIHAAIGPSHGHLIACHWRHSVEGWVLDGPDVHRVIDAHPGFTLLHSDRYEDYDLALWQAR